MLQIVLKDEPDIDPNDQNSILEHLDNVVCAVIQFIILSVSFIYVIIRIFCFFHSFLLQILLADVSYLLGIIAGQEVDRTI